MSVEANPVMKSKALTCPISGWPEIVLMIWLVLGTTALARADAPPTPSPAVPPSATTPPAPSPPTTPPAPAPTAPKGREELLEERLLKMEEMNQRLMNQVETLSNKLEDLTKKAEMAQAPGGDKKPEGPQGTIGRGTLGGGNEGSGSGPGGEARGAGNSAAAVGEGEAPNVSGGRARGAEGTIARSRTEEKPRKINTTISNGLRWTSEDDEFQLVFHDLTQSELRNFPGVGGTSPLKTGFFIPRQRWYITGRATKNVEFYTVINRGYGSLDLLDAFIDLNFDPRIKFRAGRTKTPTSYEYYQIAEGDLIAPERSLYSGNLSGNRQNGFMFHGQVLEKRAEYALGVFNGPRRSFGDFNNDKDLYAFFNIRPFQKSETLTGLKYFNIGGEYDFGNEDNVVQPSAFHTANDQSSAASNSTLATLSPTFLTFNNNVTEYGSRAHWSAWIAWYYKSLNILAQYDGGYQDYSQTGHQSVKNFVPTEGFFVQAYYFLTGEQITRRVDVKPLRNFAFKDGKLTGPGAIELHARFSTLDLGKQIFTAGLADPNLWSNHAYTVDTGLNWYLNQYTKIYVDLQHAGFNTPVFNGVNAKGQTNLIRSTDLVWLRFQLFF
jgi:phosphate-selective porin OprO/OprP